MRLKPLAPVGNSAACQRHNRSLSSGSAKFRRIQWIVTAIRALLDTDNVVVNRPAAEAGLWLLEAGGDFADGIIAYEGDWLGGEIFVSFDKQAVKLLTEQGRAAQLLAS